MKEVTITKEDNRITFESIFYLIQQYLPDEEGIYQLNIKDVDKIEIKIVTNKEKGDK